MKLLSILGRPIISLLPSVCERERFVALRFLCLKAVYSGSRVARESRAASYRDANAVCNGDVANARFEIANEDKRKVTATDAVEVPDPT